MDFVEDMLRTYWGKQRFHNGFIMVFFLFFSTRTPIDSAQEVKDYVGQDLAKAGDIPEPSPVRSFVVVLWGGFLEWGYPKRDGL